MALAIVGVMVLTGFAVFGQATPKSAPAPDAEEQPEPANVLAGGRELTYSIDHMFELYEKSHDTADLGRWNGTMGLNGWWPLRQTGYQEYQARTSYPFVLVYDPYSTKTAPDIDMGNSITTWYRLTIDAKNITEISNGPSKDPIFTPVLGPINTAGAWMNISWYGTYLETWEMQAIRAGTHYANTYYGVPMASTPLASADDGYWHELQGKLTFNRAAASKILGLSAAGDLRTQFSTAELTIEGAWFTNWMTEGGPGAAGIYDTYTAYDYSNDIRWLELYLDPASTADNLIIRFWSVSWGNEVLLIRYMEAANITRYWQGWPDDWYLNITSGPDGGSVQSRAVMGYHMYATKDSTNTLNGWALEASHMDWCGNLGVHSGYQSPYNLYDPDKTAVTHVSWAPLTTKYGMPVSYILAPLHWNLTAGEKFIVKLPSASTSVLAYNPIRSASDLLGATKTAEMAANMVWGEMVMGNGYPKSGPNNLKNFYNSVTKTITLEGPRDFAKNWNPAFPTLLDTGAPMFVLNVAKVSDYNVEIVGDTPPYDNLVTGTPYTLRVTALNGTGSPVPSYNGTFDFTSTDATAAFGVSHHHWVPADNGVFETTVTFGALGTFYVNATDANYTMDANASITVIVTALIPEFPTLLVPVIGSAALLVALKAKRKRS
ncbi:MAG: Ig-like domain-containing protein [Thermoplasmatota archaeon]|nr:Ig-like domain-containing protein [Candidatus Thermoplasmatota archaeon]MBU1914949.1 Ig-like domain-containing protein [Candidatus Thermoplasmatota archaeon]